MCDTDRKLKKTLIFIILSGVKCDLGMYLTVDTVRRLYVVVRRLYVAVRRLYVAVRRLYTWLLGQCT